MVHFFDPSSEKMRGRVPQMLGQVDILLGNLEDAIPVERKEAAREGLIAVARANDFGDTQLWTRVNSLDSPWFLDDMLDLVDAIGDRLDVIMLPKVNGPWDVQYVDQLLAQLEARRELSRPIMLHAILETATGVANVEAIATASPRMQGMSLGPSDLAASRRMKTTRVGGPHPGYIVRDDADPARPDAPRATYMQDPWHYTLARMVDACAAAASSRSTAPSATSPTTRPARISSATPSSWAASGRGRCTRARSRSRGASSGRTRRRWTSRGG